MSTCTSKQLSQEQKSQYVLDVFRLVDDSCISFLLCTFLISSGEAKIVIHVNGHVKDIYIIYLFMLHVVCYNYGPQTRSMLLFLHNMVLVHIAQLIKINRYAQYAI